MKILVCIKQVPDTETKIKVSDNGIDTGGIKWVMNPYDEIAVEEAIKTKEANAGATVTVMGLGPKKRVVDSLRTALAMGADDAIVIDADESFDSFATAKALAAAASKNGPYDIIFTGKLAIDDNQSAVSQMISEFLNIPHTTVVSKITFEDSKVVVERETEGGTKEIVEMSQPSLIAANKGLNMPRYASLPGIMKAKKKPLIEMSTEELEVDASSIKTKYTNYRLPADKPEVKILEGDLTDQVSLLAKLLREEAKVI